MVIHWNELDLIMGGPDRKSEGLGTKIWPDGRLWAENKWPEFFWDGFGIDVWPAGWPKILIIQIKYDSI